MNRVEERSKLACPGGTKRLFCYVLSLETRLLCVFNDDLGEEVNKVGQLWNYGSSKHLL